MTIPASSVRLKLTSKTNQGGPSLQIPFREPGNYTCIFGVGNKVAIPDPTLAVGNITPTAEVIWSLGGNDSRRLVSVFNGSSITGAAEHVLIRVFDETAKTDLSNVTQYTVAAMVAKGTRGSNALPPTYQQYITNGSGAFGTVIILAGSSVVVPVPQNAGVASVMVTAELLDSTAIVTERALVSQDAAFGTQLKIYEPNRYAFVPLSAQCEYITLYGWPSTGNDGNFSVTWGIDG
jgi:hypothetical protein